MRIVGKLASYQPECTSHDMWIMTSKDDYVHLEGDERFMYLAYESHDLTIRKGCFSNVANVVIQVNLSKLFDLWICMVPYVLKSYPITYQNITQVKAGVRMVSFLLRRGLSPLNVRQVDEEAVTLLLTEPEDEAWKSHAFLNFDGDSALHVGMLESKSKGVIKLVSEMYGPLENKSKTWHRYRDMFYEVVTGYSVVDLLAEHSGHAPDVVMDVFAAMGSIITDTVRMGLSIGLNLVQLRVPKMGSITVQTAYYPRDKERRKLSGRLGLFKPRIRWTPDYGLRDAIERDINDVSPDMIEFGKKTTMSFSRKKTNWEERSQAFIELRAARKAERDRLKAERENGEKTTTN